MAEKPGKCSGCQGSARRGDGVLTKRIDAAFAGTSNKLTFSCVVFTTPVTALTLICTSLTGTSLKESLVAASAGIYAMLLMLGAWYLSKEQKKRGHLLLDCGPTPSREAFLLNAIRSLSSERGLDCCLMHPERWVKPHAWCRHLAVPCSGCWHRWDVFKLLTTESVWLAELAPDRFLRMAWRFQRNPDSQCSHSASIFGTVFHHCAADTPKRCFGPAETPRHRGHIAKCTHPAMSKT